MYGGEAAASIRPERPARSTARAPPASAIFSRSQRDRLLFERNDLAGVEARLASGIGQEEQGQ